MATKIDTKKLLDVTNASEWESSKTVKLNEYQGLYNTDQTAAQMELYTYEVSGNNLVVTVAEGKTVTVTDYFKANGKSKFNLLVGSDYEEDGVYGDIIADSLVTNPNPYNVTTLVDEETGKFSYTVNTSAFNDTVDLSGFQAEDPDEAAYIKKGFTVNTNQGDDTVTGSVLADTIKTGDGDDVVIASTGDDKYTLGKGENTLTYTAANFTDTGFGNDTVNLTKGEELAVAHTYDEEQVETYVKGKDVVVDAYSKSTVSYNKTEVSYSTEHRNYFDTAKVVTNDGGTVDLQVTVEDSAVTSVKVYDATEEGYVEATEIYKDYVNATAGYQRLYVVLDEDEEAIESAYVVDYSAEEDFEDHTSLTYLTTTQGYQATANVEERKVDWEESGAAMYVASATGKVGETHNYTYFLADTYGTVKKVTYADLTKNYIVKDTAVTEYDYDNENGWTLGEYTTHTPNVVSKKGTDSTTLYEVITAQNGKEVLNEVTADYIEESVYNDTTKYVIKDDKLKDGSVTIKNAAGGTAEEISINTLDVLNHAFNVIDIPAKGNKINGTALGDVVDLSEAPINEKITGYVVNTGAGNDVVTSSQGDDTLTLGAGTNILTHTAGDDTVNLTKDEALLVTNEFNHYAIDKNDVVAYTDEAETSSVTFKNFAKGNTGADVLVAYVDAENNLNLAEEARYDVTLDDKTTKFSSAYLGADVDVAANTSKALTVDLSKTQYDNTVVLTNAKGKVTVKGGSAGDTVTAGAGADTVTLGKGTNTLTKAGLGDDVVNLTKDEDLTVGFTTDTDSIDWKVVKNDVVVTTLDDEGEELGSVTFKNFAAKDPDADVTLDVDGLEQFTEDKALDALQFKTTWNDDEDAVAVAGETIVTSKTKSFTGSRLIDVVDASKFTLYNGEDAITVVEKPEDFVEVKPKRSDYNTKEEYNAALAEYKAALAEYKEALAEYNTYAKAKGVTVNGKDGANEFTGSIYADTYKGGVDNDTITASLGNDTYTLGAGANVADYTAAEHYHNDTYNLAKEGSLELQYAEGTELTYTKVGNDILVSEGEGDYVTLKNLTSGKVNDDVKIKIGNDDAAGWWTKTINVEAESATVTGTRANDAYHSERAAGTTFVESYTANLGFGNDTITVDLGDADKKAADTIKITTSDKAADKLSAYEFGYNFNEGTLTVETEKGNISYTSEDYSKGLNLIDATNTKWAFEVAATDLSKSKTNNIAWAAGNVVDSKKNDIIIGADADQTFTYTAGKDLYKGGEGNDTYKVDLNKNTTLVVSDNAGDNVLSLADDDKYALYFNVKADGSMEAASDLAVIDLDTYFKYDRKEEEYVANEKATKSLVNGTAKGIVVLDDAIAYAESTATVGAFTFDGATNVNEIRQSVASWFAGKEYADTDAVLAAGIKEDVQSLMACYMVE